MKSEKSEEIKKTIRATFTHVHSPSTADADATASGEVNNNSAASGCVGTCASSGFLLTARTPKEMKASRALKVRVGVRVVSSDPVRGRIEPPRRAERELLQKNYYCYRWEEEEGSGSCRDRCRDRCRDGEGDPPRTGAAFGTGVHCFQKN